MVTSASGTALTVKWDVPVNEGAAIEDYDVQYRAAGSRGEYMDAGYEGTGTEATIDGLTPGTRYEVQVRATSADGTGAWSESGVGEPGALTVYYGAENYTATEGSSGAAVTVMLSESAVNALAIPISITASSATKVDDYTVSTIGPLTFSVGESTKTVTVVANEDDDSAQESVRFGFGMLPEGVIGGNTATAEVTLADDEPLTVVLDGPAGPVDYPFQVTITFSENVTGFIADDVTVVGGSVELSGIGAVYTGTVTPSGSGTVTVDVAADVVEDDSGIGGNQAAAQFSVTAEYHCTSGVSVADPTTNTGLVADCYTLLAAQDELAGTATLDWSADVAMSTWVGVTTSGTPTRVTELRLGSLGMDGTLPSGLNTLVELIALDVSNNALSGRFPTELGSLSALTELQVQDNRLSGCVPEGLRARLDGDGQSNLGDLKYCDNGPEKPERPQLLPLPGNIMVVDWDEPGSQAAIIEYELRHRVAGEDDAEEATRPAYLTLSTIRDLLPGRSYEVQVRARSAHGTGAWSEPGVEMMPPVLVAYGAASYTATEGGADASVTVRLSVPAVEELTIPINATAAAGTEPGDYTVSGVSDGALTFAEGESSKVLTVTATDDDDSANESTVLSFGELPLGASEGTTTVATVTLNDNDPLTVTLSGPEGTVDEAFAVTIMFSEEVTGFDVAEVTVVGGTVTLSGSGAEYTATVTPSGPGTVTVDVAASVVEDDAGSGGNQAADQLSVTVEYSCSSGFTIADPADNEGLVADCEALRSVRDQLAGTATLNWSVVLALSSWEGVATEGTPLRVTGLALRSKQLDGSIAAEIGNLAGLTTLDLGNNELSGSIPSELGDLNGLESLHLDSNELTGYVPEDLANLSSLTALYLQFNELSGCVPAALGTIPTNSRDFGELQLCDARPPRMLAPAVTTDGPTSVSVAWTEPSITGAAIDGYDVQYREADETAFTAGVPGHTSPTTTIMGLLSGRIYEVQVRATSDGEAGPWSPSGYGETHPLSVTFTPGPFTAVEGGSAATVVVALSVPPSEEIAIPIRTMPLGTTEPGDFAASELSGGSLSFAASQQTASITVTASEDSDSADEAVLLEFDTLPESVSEGTLSSARIALNDNDPEPLDVQFGAARYTAVEGGTAVSIPVQLNQAALRNLQIPIIVTPRGTTALADYAVGGLAGGELTFAVGERSTTMTLVAVDDGDAADEGVELSFGPGVPAGTVATAEVTLEDDDAEALTVSFSSASYMAVEGESGVWVVVELGQEARAGLTVTVTVQGHGTTAPEDFMLRGLSADGTMEFAAGDRTKLFLVTAAEDADTVDEMVVMSFGAGVPAGAIPRAVVTLVDDDGEGVSFQAESYRFAETGSLQVWVNLVPAPDADVAIPIIVTPQGSTAATDYAVVGLTSGTLTISAGQEAKRFHMVGLGDDDNHEGEIALSFGELPAGVSPGSIATAEVTIVDDDAEESLLGFFSRRYLATEGERAEIAVTLDTVADEALEVAISALPRGTTASSDYTLTGLTNGLLTISAGESTGLFTITANEDGDAADEVVEIGFSGVPLGTRAGVRATTEILLTDNDESAFEVNFGAVSYVAAEASGAVEVTVELTQAAQSELVLPVTVAARGTTEDSDYAVSGLSEDGTLTFALGATSRTFKVTAFEDADAASEEVVFGFSGGVVPVGETAVAVVTLQDDDTTALNVQFGASSYTATEGGTAASVVVTLNQVAWEELAIPITVTPRDTTQAADYGVSGLTNGGALAFAVGERSQTFIVAANTDNDTVEETVVLGFGGVVPSGAIPVALVNLKEGTSGGGLAAAIAGTGTVVPEVSFAEAEYDVREGDEIRITVKLSTPLSESLAVPITASAQGNTQADDYALSGLSESMLVFESDERERTFTIRAREDSDADHETVVLGFGTLPRGVEVGRPETATVRIEDDERVVYERIARVNKWLVPHLAQATTASVLEAISGRISAARDDVWDAEYDTTGLERLRSALAAREHDGEIDPSAVLPSLQQVLGDSGFVLPLTGAGVESDDSEARSESGPTLWGTGDYQSLNGAAGNPDDGEVSWNGNLFSAHVGFDAPVSEHLLAGVALSWSQGAFDYRDEYKGQTGSGTHGTWTLSAHPYLSWSPVEALGLWATIGYGGGSLEVDDEAAEVDASDMTRIAAAGGLQATMSDERLLPGGTTSLTARGEGAYTWTDMAGSELIEPLTVQVLRGRLAVEASHERTLPWGSSIRPALEVGVRYDGGDGLVGVGLEIGGSLRYLLPWGLTVEGRGRMLAVHQSAYEEWAAGGRLSLDLGQGRHGLSVSVAPSYGRTASGIQRLWENGVPNLTNSGNGVNGTMGRVDTELSYGIPVADTHVVVTPYGGMSLSGDGTQQYQVGGKLDLGSALRLDLKGEHGVAPSGSVSQSVGIEGTLRL